MAWFREARFGLFIHWGVYAVPAGEWNGKSNYGEWFLEETKIPVPQYQGFAQGFTAEKFDARAWVRLAKEAGMKYIVITSRHHDGFAIYPSRHSAWDIAATPFKRDPLLELAQACRAEGIRLCFYHSIMDWHHPDYAPRRAHNDVAPQVKAAPDMDRYVAFMKGQLAELVTRYGPLGILWFDGEWESSWTHERAVDLYNYVRALQPDIIINNRIGKGRSGMQGMDKGQGVGDYGTPEQEIPATGFGPGVDWESCMTMNNHWGYNKADQNWKSSRVLVRNLIESASKGGNYLLNVGPTSAGEIPAPSIERLREIGAWMKVNRAAIYNTNASPFRALPWGRATTRADRGGTSIYLHVFDWPTNGRLVVPGLTNRVQSASLLAGGRRLRAVGSTNGVTIEVPNVAPDDISSTVVLRIEGRPQVETALRQNADGSLDLDASSAILSGKLGVQTTSGVTNVGWWTQESDVLEWPIKITRPGLYAVTAQIAAPEATRFQVQVLADDAQPLLTLDVSASATGSFEKFQTVRLGTLQVPPQVLGRELKLRIKPGPDAWKAMNLARLRLSPLAVAR